jgi:S-layer protein
VLAITVGGNAIAAADLANVTAIENFNTVGNAGALDITLDDANVAAGVTLSIDTSSMTTTVATIDASAETDGAVSITAGGTGAHVITLGAGNDTYTSTSSGIDTVTATAGNNTISTGGGVDVVTSGTGADTITFGAGADNELNLSTAHFSGSAVDVITDFTSATVVINVDVSETDGTVVQLDDSTANEAAGAVTLRTITGAFDLGGAVAGDGLLVVNLDGNVANASALETALEFGGSAQITVDGQMDVGDSFFAAYDDGTDSYIAEVTVGFVALDDGQFGIGTLTATNVLKLAGIADVTDIAAADFVFI